MSTRGLPIGNGERLEHPIYHLDQPVMEQTLTETGTQHIVRLVLQPTLAVILIVVHHLSLKNAH